MSHKFFCLVLHSHIPYVLGHGAWPHGTDWLYEATAESYLPLLDVFYRLRDEGIAPKINISFTPVLMDQLRSESFISGFKNYLKMKIEIARQDRAYFQKAGLTTLLPLTFFWENWYEKLADDFSFRWQEDILGAFRELQDQAQVEILTSAATHAYLPLLSDDESLRLQIRVGKQVYSQHFGREPRGFWLPECAYRPRYAWKRPIGSARPILRPGVDELLQEEKLSYFLVDTHLLRGGEVKGVYLDRFPALRLLWEKAKREQVKERKETLSPYWPYLVEPSGLAFFVRDEKSGHQVWSSKTGYPGDGWYLEFHKKHFPGGMRYWRVTSSAIDLGEKELYNPEKTKERLEENANHFVENLVKSLHHQPMGVIAALYDTELFGHWWFEGPEWLYLVLKKLMKTEIKPEIASRCLEIIKPELVISLPEGSWGTGGFHWIWLNEQTAWIWEKIYGVEEEAKNLARLAKKNKRIYHQFLREKLLLESSDWPFLISTWTARDYAEHRAALHFERARTLAGWLRKQETLQPEEQRQLATWEEEDNLFSTMAEIEDQFSSS